jgi:hypothetical protein
VGRILEKRYKEGKDKGIYYDLNDLIEFRVYYNIIIL